MQLTQTNYRNAATYVFCHTCLESTSGNLYIPISEVENYLGIKISEKDFYKICNTIREEFRDQVLDVNEDDDEYAWEEGEFNMNIGTDYVLQLEEEEGEDF
jgi:hypothetical protein